jgi:hypothetical protein
MRLQMAYTPPARRAAACDIQDQRREYPGGAQSGTQEGAQCALELIEGALLTRAGRVAAGVAGRGGVGRADRLHVVELRVDLRGFE